MPPDARLRDRILGIVADVLKLPPEELDRDGSSGRTWDSLSHLNIVLGVEEACDVRFAAERIPQLVNVEVILKEVSHLRSGVVSISVAQQPAEEVRHESRRSATNISGTTRSSDGGIPATTASRPLGSTDG